jgi:endonuclease III
MPNTTNKQRLLALLFSSLKNRYGTGEPGNRPVFEQFLYAVCREGTTQEKADRAFRALSERFFDWNEIRVSSARELEDALADLPEPESRAARLISLLQEIFETTFSFDLESLHKKGLKQAAKQLSRYQAANDYAVSWVVQHALGGHAIPVDAPTLRVLRRLGLLEDNQDDSEVLRASLEHLIPKTRGPLFGELLSALAEELCGETDPNCASCPLCHECPTGQEAAREPVTASRGIRPKPR